MNIKFTIFKNQLVGFTKSAKNFDDLLENKMTKKEKEFWSHIQFKDKENQTIQINRQYIEEEKMSVEECIEDWKKFGDLEEEIFSIN